MEQLKDILREVISYKDDLNMPKLSDDMILDCACRIFNSQNIQERKKSNQPEKGNENGQDESVTPGQRKFLSDIGYEGEKIDSLTKTEAHHILKEYSKKNMGYK